MEEAEQGGSTATVQRSFGLLCRVILNNHTQIFKLTRFRAKKLCDQKIDTASETYEMVDGFIQKLDCDTAKFTTFVQQKHANAGPVAGTSSSSRNKSMEF
jgi:hypothetical protein